MKKGYFYIGLTTILFSSMEIVLKFISGDFNPVQLTCSRFLIGGIFLLPFALIIINKKQIHLNIKSLLKFSLLGLIGIVISMTLYQLAVLHTNASVVAVLFSSNPVFVMFFAYLLLKEPIHRYNIASLLFEVLGILLIINPLHTKLNFFGVILTLLATLLFALYGVLGKHETQKYGGLIVTCFGFLCGSAEMLLLSFSTHIPAFASFLINHNLQQFANIPMVKGYSLLNLPFVLFVYIGVTGIGYASYFKAMEITSANKTSLVFFFKPILAPILAYFILKEDIPFNMLMGIFCILIGSFASILPGLIRKEQLNQTN